MGQIALSSLMAKSSGSITPIGSQYSGAYGAKVPLVTAFVYWPVSLGIALGNRPFCQPPPPLESLESNNIIACHPLGQSLFV